MLCLSGFELYSRWVPLIHNKKLFVMCNLEYCEHCLMVSFKLDTMLCPGVVWDGASICFSKHEAILSCLKCKQGLSN